MLRWIPGTLLALLLCGQDAAATGTWCAVAEKTSDGFVNLRSGPGAGYKVVGTVRPADYLHVDTAQCREAFGGLRCDAEGKWVFVEAVYEIPNVLRDLQGWINGAFVRQVACDYK